MAQFTIYHRMRNYPAYQSDTTTCMDVERFTRLQTVATLFAEQEINEIFLSIKFELWKDSSREYIPDFLSQALGD